MGQKNSSFQPELPFEHFPESQAPVEIASGPPEFIANNPLLLEAWKRGNQKAQFILGDGKEGQQLPLPQAVQPERTPEVFPPVDKEELERVAIAALHKQIATDRAGAAQSLVDLHLPHAVLGSAAKLEHSPLSKEDAERGVRLKPDSNYGGRGYSPAAALELKKADHIAHRNDKRRR